jgi:DNA-binding transcriptional LysR family regulator
MTNIPTDLLRTLVAVVDLRSFTKAAVRLGVTQPAVSAQIKRLQSLLGGELFDRRAQGVSLTPHGEMVVGYARRLLSINDHIVHLGGGPRSELAIRIGTPNDFVASILPGTLAGMRERWPDVRFIVRTNFYEPLLRELRGGELDVLVGLSMNPANDARHSWAHDLVWVRGATTCIDPTRPVPLVRYGESCVYHQLATTALKSAGLDWEDVFTGPSTASLASAVTAGLGVMATMRERAEELGMTLWQDAPLPKLPDIYSGIYVREGGARAAYEQLADEIAAVLRASSTSGPQLAAITAA